MNRLTITQFEDELVGTYDTDDTILAVKAEATGDFLFDCANMILNIEQKLKEKARTVPNG